MNIEKVITLSTLLLCAGSVTTSAESFRGVEFPAGAASFADEVISYQPDFSNGNLPTQPSFTDPEAALGSPDFNSSTDQGAVSLGSGGRITLRFSNNKLTGSNSTDPDIHVFEVGPDVEDTFVDISKDGTEWHSLGKVFGATSSIDIDAFGFTAADEFTFVRLTDDPSEGGTGGVTPGADIDAVGAISTSSTVHAPELEIHKAVLVEFDTFQGSLYTLQASTNRLDWTDVLTGIEGDGTEKQFFFPATEPKNFYRVKPAE